MLKHFKVFNVFTMLILKLPLPGQNGHECLRGSNIFWNEKKFKTIKKIMYNNLTVLSVRYLIENLKLSL